jgi:hypothetical protein
MPSSILALAIVLSATVVIAARPTPINAADLAAPTAHAAKNRVVRRSCGVCGCLRVVYSYHRRLWFTYGLGFDPRNYDMTEPHFHLGRVRAYPQYVEGGRC